MVENNETVISLGGGGGGGGVSDYYVGYEYRCFDVDDHQEQQQQQQQLEDVHNNLSISSSWSSSSELLSQSQSQSSSSSSSSSWCAYNCTSLISCQYECNHCSLIITELISPFNSDLCDVIFCSLPIIFLTYVTVKTNPLPTAVSLPVAALMMLLIRLIYLGSDPILTFASVITGVHETFTLLTIMAGSMLLLETMESTYCLPYMIREIKVLTAGHVVAELMLMFAFMYLVEGVCGFGTVAVGAPMLVYNGHPPMESLILLFVFNTMSCVWGGIGIPLWFGLGSLGVTDDELLVVSEKAAVGLACAGIFIIPTSLTLLVPWKDVQDNALFITYSFISTVGATTIIAAVSYEFAALVGGIIGCTLIVFGILIGVGGVRTAVSTTTTTNNNVLLLHEHSDHSSTVQPNQHHHHTHLVTVDISQHQQHHHQQHQQQHHQQQQQHQQYYSDPHEQHSSTAPTYYSSEFTSNDLTIPATGGRQRHHQHFQHQSRKRDSNEQQQQEHGDGAGAYRHRHNINHYHHHHHHHNTNNHGGGGNGEFFGDPAMANTLTFHVINMGAVPSSSGGGSHTSSSRRGGGVGGSCRPRHRRGGSGNSTTHYTGGGGIGNDMVSVAAASVASTAAVTAKTEHQFAQLGERLLWGEGYVRELISRTFPIWGVVLILIITRVEQFGIKGLLTKQEPTIIEGQIGTLGYLKISSAGVIQLHNILNYPDMNWKYELFYAPFLIPFVIVSIITFSIYRDYMIKTIPEALGTVMKRLHKTSIALCGALILVQLMINDDQVAPAYVLGSVLAKWFRGGFVVISPLLGALGCFFSGSGRVSNLTFGDVSIIAAKSINVSKTSMLALQAIGASAGSALSLNNIIAACAVINLNVGEGKILLQTSKYVFCCTFVATTIMILFFFQFW